MEIANNGITATVTKVANGHFEASFKSLNNYHIHGFTIQFLPRNKVFIGREREGATKGYSTTHDHFYQRVFNLWERPDEKWIKENWRVLLSDKVVQQILFNPDSVKQIWLDILWKDCP
jgi:hypothetical protein